jgi:HK97 family phage major capsid protein
MSDHVKELATELAPILSYPACKGLNEWLESNKYLTPAKDAYHALGDVAAAAAKAIAEGKLEPETLERLTGGNESKEETMAEKTTAEKLFSKAPGNSSHIRVKATSEHYSDKRASAVHVKTGKPVFDEYGSEVSRPSQKSLAMAGVTLKYAARKAGMPTEWTEHDEQLLTETIETQEWASYQGEPGQCKIYAPGAIKAPLLDESGGSGGLEVTPITFDDSVITTPLLVGELLPQVDLKPIARGRRIEGASIGTPTAQWNEGDNSTGTLFDSTSQIAALDSTVFDLSCHVEVGLNFMSDSPLNIGNILVQLIGERMSNELEKVIAEGDGTTQPQGIKTASGTNSVSFGAAAATAAKYVELLFSVPKEQRGNFAFIANETTYRRARSIATGVTGDTRFVFNMDVENYNVLGRPYLICHHLSNAEILAGNMSKYRLYRRLGSQVTWTTQGSTLQRRNMALLTVRQRWAGRPMLASAFSVVTNAEA